jgi:hypothetical protein
MEIGQGGSREWVSNSKRWCTGGDQKNDIEDIIDKNVSTGHVPRFFGAIDIVGVAFW